MYHALIHRPIDKFANLGEIEVQKYNAFKLLKKFSCHFDHIFLISLHDIMVKIFFP